MAAIIHRITNKSAFNRLLIKYLNSAGFEYTANIGPGDNEPKEFCGQQYSFKFQTVEERSGNPPVDAQEYNDYTLEAGSTCDRQPPGNGAGTGDVPKDKVNTIFKLRLISTNTAGSKQTNILNGVKMQSGEVVEFDAKNFKSGVSVQSEYDSNAFNLLTTNKRFQLQGESTLFIYTTTNQNIHINSFTHFSSKSCDGGLRPTTETTIFSHLKYFFIAVFTCDVVIDLIRSE